MNTKSTDLSRDKRFDMPDSPSFTSEQIKGLSICFGIGFLCVVFTLAAICNADKIDLFFQNVYKFFAL